MEEGDYEIPKKIRELTIVIWEFFMISWETDEKPNAELPDVSKGTIVMMRNLWRICTFEESSSNQSVNEGLSAYLWEDLVLVQKFSRSRTYRYKSEAERSENPQNWRFSQNFFKTTVQTLRRQRLLPRVRWTPHGHARRPPSRFHRHDKLQKFQIHPLQKKPIIPSDSPAFLLSSSVKSLPSQNTTVSTSSASPSFSYFRT